MCYLVRTPGGNTGPVRDAESPRVDQYCIYSTVPGTAVQYSSATVLYCTREFMCYLVHKVPGGNSGPDIPEILIYKQTNKQRILVNFSIF